MEKLRNHVRAIIALDVLLGAVGLTLSVVLWTPWLPAIVVAACAILMIRGMVVLVRVGKSNAPLDEVRKVEQPALMATMASTIIGALANAILFSVLGNGMVLVTAGVVMFGLPFFMFLIFAQTYPGEPSIYDLITAGSGGQALAEERARKRATEDT